MTRKLNFSGFPIRLWRATTALPAGPWPLAAGGWARRRGPARPSAPGVVSVATDGPRAPQRVRAGGAEDGGALDVRATLPAIAGNFLRSGGAETLAHCAPHGAFRESRPAMAGDAAVSGDKLVPLSTARAGGSRHSAKTFRQLSARFAPRFSGRGPTSALLPQNEGTAANSPTVDGCGPPPYGMLMPLGERVSPQGFFRLGSITGAMP